MSTTTAPNFSKLINLLKKNDRVKGSGIPNGADSFLIEQCRKKFSSIVVLAADLKDAERLNDEINAIEEGVADLLPEAHSVPYNMRSTFGPTQEKRLQTMKKFLTKETSIVVTTTTALFEKTISPRTLFNSTIHIAVNDDIEQATLSEWLTNLGFKRESSVSEPGSYAIRGGIVDIYPFGFENPIRIEFWGDTIDSIREFDIFKQKSLRALQQIEIIPMKELLPTLEERDAALEKVAAFVKKNRIEDRFYDVIEHSWGTIAEIDGLEWFLHWFDKETTSLIDYFADDTLIIYSDYLSLPERQSRLLENYGRHLTRVPELQKPFVSEPELLLWESDQIEEALAPFKTLLMKGGSSELPSEHYDFVPQPSFSGDLTLLKQDLAQKTEKGYTITILSETKGHLDRLHEQLADYAEVELRTGFLKCGFFSLKKKVAIYSEPRIFDRLAQKKLTAGNKKSAPIINYDTLTKGDIVVHVDHGLGLFKGITTITAGDMKTDCMVIEYKDKAKIHVPITDFHKVQKYIGARDGANAPALSKLGSSAWEKKKEKTKRDLQEMANKLIKLYATREFSKGVQIGSDTDWQQEFEDSFLYTATPDQDKAMVEIKKDLESERPMDRLVCGDVGFGKTEVAMRAAFKAVMDGFQVAILAPTTVLASQHGKTFRERMYDFPVNISTLSRMTNSGSVSNIKAGLASGEINIVVGTHKILSKSIQYKNLGLVIIDEEQRFGVKQKERFTELRHSINVLSMSATPIPRTLHMSMAGIRDLSLIATPPVNRLPVETTVSESHDELFQRAIIDEMERGGQVFVVLNRISGLDELHARIEELVPNARICVAHGQMDGEIVDEVMSRFTAGDFDILLSTTIIENGIDISNANTIIVEQSDRLGLSQLYQLRGRVGRSSQQGFAYFFVKSFAAVKEESIKRLKALEQYTDLGSGFQLAMRDLELRGAGNLLGTDQSGSIAAVGFELYCQLLKEEIERIRHNKRQDNIAKEPEISIGIQGHFPSTYISEGNLRIVLYQRGMSIKKLEDLRDFEKELADRFGPLPDEVIELLTFIEIKILAIRFHISQIDIKDETLKLVLDGDSKVVQQTTALLLDLKNGNFKMTYGDTISMITKLAQNRAIDQAHSIRNILKQLLYMEGPKGSSVKKKSSKRVIKKR